MSSSRAGVVIVGGGIVGSSVAYHLMCGGFTEKVVVVERDPTYQYASTRRAFGGIRQQFCSRVNVALAQRSVAFYERFDQAMAVDGRPAAGKFRKRGYLFLADATNAERLDRRFALMKEAGAHVEKVDAAAMRRLVPEMDAGDLRFGILGPDDGYGDTPALLAGFRARAASMGAEYLADEISSADTSGGRVRAVVLRGAGRIETERLVCAGGATSGEMGRLLGVDIPVTPVRQQLVRAELPRPWSYEFPVVIDPSGVHWRSYEGNTIVIARTESAEPPGVRFETDPGRFDQLLPLLARRVPELAGLRHVATWAGLYEMTADHNPLLGPHPDLDGLHLACGFSGHGVMMAPATGEVLAAMLTARPPPIDVTALRPDRFRTGDLLHDEAMI